MKKSLTLFILLLSISIYGQNLTIKEVIDIYNLYPNINDALVDKGFVFNSSNKKNITYSCKNSNELISFWVKEKSIRYFVFKESHYNILKEEIKKYNDIDTLSSGYGENSYCEYYIFDNDKSCVEITTKKVDVNGENNTFYIFEYALCEQMFKKN